MKVVRRELDQAFMAKCDQCGEIKNCRRVEAVGKFHESRGYYNICFDCIAPEIYFKGRDGKIYHTPDASYKKESSHHSKVNGSSCHSTS